MQVPGDENAKVDHTKCQDGQVDFKIFFLDRVLHMRGQAIGEPDFDEHRTVTQREADGQEQSSTLRENGFLKFKINQNIVMTTTPLTWQISGK